MSANKFNNGDNKGDIRNKLNANADLIDGLTTSVGTKVDKVNGKQLSTEDYSTAEKSKLAGVPSSFNPATVGLGSVDNTSDASKASTGPIATAIAAVSTNLLSGVPTEGNTLNKLYTSLQALQAYINGDDINLDTIKELSDAIKSDEGLIAAMNAAKVNITDISNVLTITISGKVLDARQGKILNDAIIALTATVGNKVDKVTGKQLSANDYTDADKAKVGAAVVASDFSDIDQNLSSPSTNAVSSAGVAAAFTAIKGGYTGTLQDLYNLITSGLTPLAAPVLTLGTPTSSNIPMSANTPTHTVTWVYQKSTSADFSTGVTTLSGSGNTNDATGLAASTQFWFRAKVQASGYADSPWSTIVTATTAASSGGGGTIVPMVFATRDATVNYNAGANSYSSIYVDADGWGATLAGSGKKLAAGTDGAIYAAANGVANEFILGFNTADSGGFYSLPFGFRFNSLAYPDLYVYEDGTGTYIESFATGTDYRLKRTSGVWKLQKSTDNWATVTDLFTFAYAGGGDLYPIGDMRTTSINEGSIVSPRQSGLV